MATVFALIFLPALAALGLMGLTAGGTGSVLMFVTFALLAAGVFVGLYRMMQHWEEEPV